MHPHKPNYNFFSGSNGGGVAATGGTSAPTHHMTCTNCASHGHSSKHCPQPIMSYGVILFRTRAATPGIAAPNQAEGLLAGLTTGTDTTSTITEFLMIQRRDSIGFVELMRGKYKLTDTDYIVQQIAGMTAAERERLLAVPFDDLWADLWGTPTGHQSYRHEKEIARGKLEALRTGAGAPLLRDLVAVAPPPWPTAEWGFPKGRRDANESEYACAMRELWEETNIDEKSITVVRNLEPLQETFTGSNAVRYCHKYYVAYAPPGTGEEGYATAAAANEHIRREVGNIQWMTADVALALLRPENPEKRKMLLRVTELTRNYCPFECPGAATGRQRR